MKKFTPLIPCLTFHFLTIAPNKKSSRFVFSGDEEVEPEANEEDSSSSSLDATAKDNENETDGPVDAADNEEGGEEEGEEEDPVEEDMQIAWETLDLARVVYEKMGESSRGKVADVLLVLGDVSLEQGNAR